MGTQKTKNTVVNGTVNKSSLWHKLVSETKTVYARVVLLLLAVSLCLSGYVVSRVLDGCPCCSDKGSACPAPKSAQ